MQRILCGSPCASSVTSVISAASWYGSVLSAISTVSSYGWKPSTISAISWYGSESIWYGSVLSIDETRSWKLLATSCSYRLRSSAIFSRNLPPVSLGFISSICRCGCWISSSIFTIDSWLIPSNCSHNCRISSTSITSKYWSINSFGSVRFGICLARILYSPSGSTRISSLSISRRISTERSARKLFISDENADIPSTAFQSSGSLSASFDNVCLPLGTAQAMSHIGSPPDTAWRHNIEAASGNIFPHGVHCPPSFLQPQPKFPQLRKALPAISCFVGQD